jgi:phosphatidylserine decarboxylase
LASGFQSVVQSIRSILVPVRPEGFPFIAIAAVLAVVLGFFWQPLFWIFFILTLWVVFFFRDPPRVVSNAPYLIVAPADGLVSYAGIAIPPKELGLGELPRIRVSIFMSVFDCHVNRSPVAGSVARIVYKPGKFLNADLDKASEDNERNGLVLATPYGEVGVVQIAGLVARRILCWTKVGDELLPGERIGMIRFGSRVDVYLPSEARLRISKGQIAVAGETMIARFGGEELPLLVRVE